MPSVSQYLVSLADAVGVRVKGLDDATAALEAARGNMSALTTAHKSTIVGAVNEIKAALNSASASISNLAAADGTLSTLTTTHKSTLVGAINEVKSGLTSTSSAVTTLQTSTGSLATLTTSAKGSLVAAVNEVAAAVASATNINDAASGTTTTYSSSKILAQITTSINALETKLTDGASDAFNTFAEFEATLAAYPDFNAMINDLAGCVSAIRVQTLTAPQKAQARANIDAVSTAELAAVDAKIGTLADPVATFNAHFA